MGVTVNALHPGVIRTNRGDTPGLQGAILRRFKKLMKSSEQGARGPIFLATAEELSDTTGCFFNQCRRFPLLPVAKDDIVANHLWDLSALLTGLAEHPSGIG